MQYDKRIIQKITILFGKARVSLHFLCKSCHIWYNRHRKFDGEYDVTITESNHQTADTVV